MSAEAGREASRPLAVYSERLAAKREAPVEIDDALVDAVLDQVRAGRITVGQGGRGGVDDEPSMRIETPYLQLVMTKIWEEERRLGSNVLRLETLNRLGGAGEIVKAHLDEQMSALSEAEQAIAAQVFDRLVTPSGTKLAQSIDDLATYSGLNRETLEPVLEKLSGRGRILHPLPAPPDRPGATRYEIFHDRLAAAVLDWRRRYLEEAERERQVEAERRRTRRLRRLALVLIGVIALVCGVAAAMVYLWVDARDQRRAAVAGTASAFAASSRALLQTDPALAVKPALLGFEKKRTPETTDALRSALLASHQRSAPRRIAGHPVAVSPDTEAALVISDDGRARVVGPAGRSLGSATTRGDQPGRPLGRDHRRRGKANSGTCGQVRPTGCVPQGESTRSRLVRAADMSSRWAEIRRRSGMSGRGSSRGPPCPDRSSRTEAR